MMPFSALFHHGFIEQKSTLKRSMTRSKSSDQREHPMGTNKETDEQEYPWLRLLDYEARKETRRPERKRKRGRPPRAFVRKEVYLTMTEDEKEVLDALTAAIAAGLDRAVPRGQVVAFMAFQLRAQLEQDGTIVIPEDVDSFTALARYLDGR
jgi:hypothetical protein